MMKEPRNTILLILFCLTAIMPVACNSQSPVARVNDQVITDEALRQELIVQHGARMLLQMIDIAIINQAARQQGVSISEGELDLKYEQAVARIGSEQDLEQILKRSRRGKREFREELRAEALLDRLAMQRYPVRDADVRQYYDVHRNEFSHQEQVRIRLMLFTTRANAEAVAETLKDPQADFAGLAQAFSEDPATKDKGGDTGFFQRGDYAPAITNLAFKLKPGQVSPVFEVPDGFAIIKVEEKRPAGVQPFEQVRESVQARVELEQLERARRNWLNEARVKAQLDMPDEALAARVRMLMGAETPFEPSNMAPDIPMAPR